MSSEHEVLEIRHENGEPFLRQYYKDGKLYRKLKYYHENGQLWIEEFYIDGRFEGERKIWHSNGQIKYMGSIMNLMKINFIVLEGSLK